MRSIFRDPDTSPTRMKPMRDAASDQLSEYKERAKPSTLTTAWGVPVPSLTAVLTAGPYGPLLARDSTFDDLITHFDRERIPERVVHAKGAGAFGYFECTRDISKYTKAKVFEVGKKTQVSVRFSQVVGEMGSADTVRDPRGFAVKFKTEEGVWDLVGNNTPIFFVRDPMLFPSFIHSQKRNPVTHLKDPNAAWDFFSLRPEATHQFMLLYSDRGIPYSYRYMDGFGQHTFKLVNAQGEPIWCKFHIKTDQGIKNLDPTLANEIAGTDPDYFIRDLYNAIHDGNHPSWTFAIQVMTFEQAKSFPWNIFDVTKVWPKKEFPLIEVGKIVLNENPQNYFEDVEQIAFCPSRLVPGIEPSEDKMLQGRMVSYGDTQRYRLGVNFLQLPVNCPYVVRVKNMERDGFATFKNQNGAPNYYPNSFGGPEVDSSAKTSPYEVHGFEDRYDSGGEDNFTQATMFWRNVLNPDERSRLINNVAQNLGLAKKFIQERALKNFYQVDEGLGQRLREALQLQDKMMAHL